MKPNGFVQMHIVCCTDIDIPLKPWGGKLGGRGNLVSVISICCCSHPHLSDDWSRFSDKSICSLRLLSCVIKSLRLFFSFADLQAHRSGHSKIHRMQLEESTSSGAANFAGTTDKDSSNRKSTLGIYLHRALFRFQQFLQPINGRPQGAQLPSGSSCYARCLLAPVRKLDIPVLHSG